MLIIHQIFILLVMHTFLIEKCTVSQEKKKKSPQVLFFLIPRANMDKQKGHHLGGKR